MSTRGVQSVAICFLHAYRNPAHERRARDILAAELPGVQVSISSEVHPEPKEYERSSTTVVDAYVKPTAAQYLDKLSADLRADGYPNNLFVMLSNGGTATAAPSRRCSRSWPPAPAPTPSPPPPAAMGW